MSDSNPKIQSRAESIFAEQIKLLVNGLPFALVTVVFISILVVFILRAEVNVIYLAVWLGLNFILSFVRLIITRSYKNKSYPPEELKRFSRLFFMGTLLSGILWGALPLALLPESFTLQVFIALVLGGMSVGATSSLSAIHKYYMAFTLPCLLPLGIRFIWMGTEMYMVIGIMNIVFVLMMILLSLRLNKNILETLNLRFEKDLLIADFMEAREQSEILNEELENEVIEKEQVATELEHTTEQLSLLLNALPIVPYVSKAYGDYGAVYISDNVKNITGFDAEEFLNDSGFWGSRIHPDDRDQVFANLPKLFERGEHHHEYRWMVSDGTYRWFYDSLKLVKTGGEKATNLIGAWLDITDRKRVEQELHDQLKFIHVLMDTIPTPIYFKDPDGIYIGCNQGFEELIGRGRNDIIGQTDEALAPKELASQYYASDWALYRHAKQNIHESVILAADKVERNVIF
ncbi:MAG: PAS domain-containing protein, partial [Spirochaetota bacterium]|nr:PAS domain-containing protein [Spirochaetota bacterium]